MTSLLAIRVRWSGSSLRPGDHGPHVEHALQAFRRCDGDHAMKLTARGRWSRDFRFHVRGGQRRVHHVLQEKVLRRELSVENATAAMVSSQDGPVVLRMGDATLSGHRIDPGDDWSCEVKCVAMKSVALTDGFPTAEDVTINFAHDARRRRYTYQPTRLHRKPVSPSFHNGGAGCCCRAIWPRAGSKSRYRSSWG